MVVAETGPRWKALLTARSWDKSVYLMYNGEAREYVKESDGFWRVWRCHGPGKEGG